MWLKSVFLGTVFIWLFSLIITPCSAIHGNSAHYNITISNVDYAAYDGHSANFNIDFSLIDQYVGVNGSPSFNTTYGFYGGVNFTGYSVGGPFDISIVATDPVTASSSATAIITLVNQNPDFGEDALVEYWIEDGVGNVITTGSKTVYVGSLSTVQTTASLDAPANAGVYVYYGRVTWSTLYTASASDSFTVTAAPDDGGDGGGGGGAPARPILRITEYPQNISLEQDDFVFYEIEVSNIGKKEADNTILVISGLSQYWFSVEPQNVDIAAGANESFALRLQIPYNAELGSYDFTIKAVSGSAEYEVNSTLNIIAEAADEVRISDVQLWPSIFFVNQTGKLLVYIENSGSINTVATVSISAPNSWEMDQTNETKTISPGEENIFEFNAIPSHTGTYSIEIAMTATGYEDRKTIAVVVEESPEGLNLLMLIIFIILAIIGFLLLSEELKLFKKEKKEKPHKGHETKPEPQRSHYAYTETRRKAYQRQQKYEDERVSGETSKKVSEFDKFLSRFRKKKK